MKRYFRERMPNLCLVFFLSLVAYAMLSSGPYFEQIAVNAVTSGNWQGFISAIIQYVIFICASFILLTLSEMVTANYIQLITRDMRQAAYAGSLRQSIAQHRQTSSADYMSMLTNDMATVRDRYLGTFFMAFTSCVGIAITTVWMFIFQPVVAAITIPLSLLMISVPWITSKRIAKLEAKRSEQLSAFTKAIKDLFEGFEVVSSFGLRRFAQKRFNQAGNTLYHAEAQVERESAAINVIAQFLSQIAAIVTLVVSCAMVFNGQMTIGALVVFESMRMTFASCLTVLLQLIPAIRGMQPVLERINALADAENTCFTGTKPPSLNKNVQVENLTFAYEEGKPVIRDLSYCFAKGGKYAVTGESGCGKTTLIRLLCGEDANYEGLIQYDGVELHDLDNEAFRQLATVIHQDVFMFDDTIYNNICLYDDFPEPVLQKALENSGVIRFLESCEGGLAYQVGEGGNRLSGGQRQRIAIARALIRNTPLLILDEGTSSVDAKTAKEIEETLLQIPELTMISVTHHLYQEHEKLYTGILEMRQGRIFMQNTFSK